MCAQMGLGFNLCVAPTLTFCPYISDGWTDCGWDGMRGEDEGLDSELGYMYVILS